MTNSNSPLFLQREYPLCFYKESRPNYEVITFNDFDTLIEVKQPNNEFSCSEKKLLERLASPGIFAIHCFPKNRTFFTSSWYNCLESMYGSLNDLDGHRYENNDLLREDYEFNDFTWYDFAFFIFCVGPEWADPTKRQQEIEKIKKTWSGNFYN